MDSDHTWLNRFIISTEFKSKQRPADFRTTKLFGPHHIKYRFCYCLWLRCGIFCYHFWYCGLGIAITIENSQTYKTATNVNHSMSPHTMAKWEKLIEFLFIISIKQMEYNQSYQCDRSKPKIIRIIHQMQQFQALQSSPENRIEEKVWALRARGHWKCQMCHNNPQINWLNGVECEICVPHSFVIYWHLFWRKVLTE